MSERKSGAQDTHVGPDCMLLYQQEGDEQHRKAAERIHWLEQEVERLRENGLRDFRIQNDKIVSLQEEVERLRGQVEHYRERGATLADYSNAQCASRIEAEARLARLVEERLRDCRREGLGDE